MRGFDGTEQCGQIEIDQIANALHRYVGRRAGELLGIECELYAERFKNGPIPIPVFTAKPTFKMGVKISYDAIVIKQRVVYVQKEKHLVRRCHVAACSGMGLNQPPSAAINASDFFGPQLPSL